jgi:ABC-2 type transport system ATP-binding protein
MSLHIQDLNFSYKNKAPILRGVHLNVEKGQKHGILGANGAGKTTLFRLITGWLPNQGKVLWSGHAIQSSEVAFLEAEPYFYPYMTGLEYLRFIRDDREKIGHWNAIFNLPLEQYAEEYSTGMKKKLALIATLLPERPLMILDEPFNGVDFESNEKSMAILQRGIIKDGTLLISSHILDTLTRVCDHISVLSEGQIIRTYNSGEFAELEAGIRASALSSLDHLMELPLI